MLEHALKYASLGLKVFPIAEGLKTPAISKGFYSAVKDTDIITKWWTDNPRNNIAIRTGKESGVLLLDIDCKKDKNGFGWVNAKGELPDTWAQLTPSGGRQYFFKMPEFYVGSNSNRLADGIDIRAEVGYTMAPPSVLTETPAYKYSGKYEWLEGQAPWEIPLASPPEWLLEELLLLIPTETTHKVTKGDEFPVSMIDAMKHYKVELKEIKPGVFQGAHPVHGSTNGANFKIDTRNNLWSCYRHTKMDGRPVGGSTIQFIAMMEGIICCENCKKGALRGKDFLNVLKVLESKFGISKTEVKREKVHETYAIAEQVRDGEIGFDYVYCIEDNKYYYYEDNYWKETHELELSKAMNENIEGINSYSLSQKNQVFGHLRVLLQKRLDCFNSSNLINFPEGEFNPITKELTPHVKEHYSTTRMPYSYDEFATCPMWEKTLLEIFENDRKKISVLQEFFGYCLVPDTSMKKALLLLGESNTGKSTILFLFKDLIGKTNYSTVALKDMGHPQYTPQMINKLVNIDTDVSKTATEYEEHFKKITSGEEINCNQKFIETFSFIPKCRIILAANIFPRITDHSSAFYNRLIVIPMDRIFTQEEMDRNLVPKLRAELAGIFNWCVEGLHRMRERGHFEELGFMKEAVDELEDTNNPSNLFFREHVEVAFGESVEKGELFQKYKEWSELNKQYTLTAAMFSTAVYKKFHKETPKKCTSPTGKRIWRNLKYVHLKLEPQENADYED